MDDPQLDRRLGARHVLGPMAVRWRLDEDTYVSSRRPTEPGEDQDPEAAGLLDLSASGVRIMARASDDITVGDVTGIAIRGTTGPVIVRRIAPSTQPGFVNIGLEFADPLSELPQLIHQELARRSPLKD